MLRDKDLVIISIGVVGEGHRLELIEVVPLLPPPHHHHNHHHYNHNQHNTNDPTWYGNGYYHLCGTCIGEIARTFQVLLVLHGRL